MSYPNVKLPVASSVKFFSFKFYVSLQLVLLVFGDWTMETCDNWLKPVIIVTFSTVACLHEEDKQ